MLTVFARAVILFAAAVVAMRLMGKRQVGQLQPFELVVVIMIAELAATPMGSVGVPLLYGILPMLALVICHGLLTFFSMKSERLRVWLCGRPTVLIRNGVICERQLRKTSFTLNDLMEELRMGGIQDPAEVATAVLETSGTVSVFPKADSRPVTPADMGLEVPAEGLPLPLVLDGHVNRANLQRGGLTEGWLNKALSALGYGPLAVVTVFGMQFLDFFEFLNNSVMMPIEAIATCLLVSRIVGVEKIEEEVTRDGQRFRRKPVFNFMLRYLCPIFAAIILASSVANALGWIAM